jgi:hypothetical protein
MRPVEVFDDAIGCFSPEFGIAAVLAQYWGGLSILADRLKAANDFGVPVVFKVCSRWGWRVGLVRVVEFRVFGGRAGGP